MKLNHGFTLVELVTVLILIGILAVNVLPRFQGTSGYESHTHRAQLIAALRLTQQRAMQQTDSEDDNYCNQIVLETTRYGVPNRTDCTKTTFGSGWKAEKDATGHEVAARYNIEFSILGKTNPQISFNWLGKPLDDCENGCIIDVTNTETDETKSIVIESEGYIHAQ